MSLTELFILAVGLSMDAFAVSMCKGLALRRADAGSMLKAGLYFGGFQAGMPLLGFFLGSAFSEQIVAIDHWIAFFLLGIIGGNMIREAIRGEAEKTDCSFCVKSMFPMAVATSIDALAVGISFAFTGMSTWQSIISPISIIGIVSFVFSVAGCLLGVYFGKRVNLRAELWAGIILIGIGTKILMEHLEVI